MTHDTVKAKIPEMLKQELGWVTFTPVLEFINMHCIIKKEEKHTEIITLTKNTASKGLHCQRKRVKEGSLRVALKRYILRFFLTRLIKTLKSQNIQISVLAGLPVNQTPKCEWHTVKFKNDAWECHVRLVYSNHWILYLKTKYNVKYQGN